MSHTKEPLVYVELGRIYSGDDFVADCAPKPEPRRCVRQCLCSDQPLKVVSDDR